MRLLRITFDICQGSALETEAITYSKRQRRASGRRSIVSSIVNITSRPACGCESGMVWSHVPAGNSDEQYNNRPLGRLLYLRPPCLLAGGCSQERNRRLGFFVRDAVNRTGGNRLFNACLIPSFRGDDVGLAVTGIKGKNLRA